MSCNSTYRLRYWNTVNFSFTTFNFFILSCNSTYRLRYWNLMKAIFGDAGDKLQQYLPLAVLKLLAPCLLLLLYHLVATVLTACGIETGLWNQNSVNSQVSSCNSTYRLRYWNETTKIQRAKYPHKVATVLTACGIETLLLLLLWLLLRIGCNSTYRLRYWNFNTV